mmetsp:Transcript_25677/g.39335  ORF Transcript_25677/g.39335 Transcript_25677/m.39335 type:complete len:157 (+) Transcript_25677:88-558(+)
MHSPEGVKRDIDQDSDPQLFELLLLEKNDEYDNILMMSDIIPLEFDINADKRNGQCRHTLRPFLFNMRSDQVQKASKSVEDIIILIKPKSSQSGEDEWEIRYEHIASYFDEGKRRAPHKVTILSEDKLEAVHSTSSDQDLKPVSDRGDPQWFDHLV